MDIFWQITIVEFLLNLAVFAAAVIAYGPLIALAEIVRPRSIILPRMAVGALFGIATGVALLLPVHLSGGAATGSQTILLAVAGLSGFAVAIPAALIALAAECVPWLRGDSGGGIAVASVVASAMAGLVLRILLDRRTTALRGEINYTHLPLLGALAGLFSLAVLWGFRGWTAVFDAALPVSISSVLAATILGTLVLHETRRNKAESDLRESEARLAHQAGELQFANTLLTTEMETSPDGILVVSESGRIMSFNQKLSEMWSVSRTVLEAGDDSAALAAVTALMKYPEAFRARVDYFYAHPEEAGHDELETVDGRFFLRYSAPMRTNTGRSLGRVWFFRDITARRVAEAEVLHTARHDVLTGLANRRVYMEVVEQAMARRDRGDRSFAVLYLDLDHFKDVNDTLGHPIGDALLCAVADRLRSVMRKADLVARFGGDEFAVIAAAIEDPSDAAGLAEKLIAAIAKPYSIQGNDIRCGVSIGIAVCEAGDTDPEALLSHADVALYRAKAEGRGAYRFFTDAMDMDVRTRVTMVAELREAIASGQFFLKYQPQVEANTGRLVGVEALVRWHHPQRGVIAPDEFIPVAEKSGLIIALDRWVMREACRQGKGWLDAGIAPPVISVNVSGVQFKMALDLEREIAAALSDSGLPPERLELELTETVFMEASREHIDVVLRLRKSGIHFAIDDFGTGYSSLDYLRRYPTARLKIAQDFVRQIVSDPGSAAIVKATIGLAREMGMVSIAEGVENIEQLNLLKTWGCRQIQGFYFAKPLLLEDLVPILRAGEIVRPAAAAAKIAAKTAA